MKLPEQLIEKVSRKLSYTKMSLALNCSFAWWLKYIYSKVHNIEVPIPLQVKYGIIYHEILENYLLHNNVDYSVFFEKYKLPIQPTDKIILQNQFRRLDQLIDQYGDPLIVEKEVAGKLGDSIFCARMDFIIGQNPVLVLDHKYANYKKSHRYIDQLMLYLYLLLHNEMVSEEVHLGINFLKDCYIDILYRYNGNFSALENFVTALYQEYLSAISIIQRNLEACKYCMWKSICQSIPVETENVIFTETNIKYINELS